MDDSIRKQLVPGAKVEVIQQISHGDHAWTNTIRGIVSEFRQKPTGSWFAHSKDDKFWLDRLTVRREDGEITMLILDGNSRVSVIAA